MLSITLQTKNRKYLKEVCNDKTMTITILYEKEASVKNVKTLQTIVIFPLFLLKNEIFNLPFR